MGLIGGMARTAVVAGTATAVSNRVSRRQANRWSAQQEPAPPPQQQYQEPPPPAYAPPPPPPPADDGPDMLDQLQKLGELRDAGVLTEAEFAAQKAKILAG
jgi:hypothetical protein